MLADLQCQTKWPRSAAGFFSFAGFCSSSTIFLTRLRRLRDCNVQRHTPFKPVANFGFLCSIPAVHLGEHFDRANLVAPMANAERLIPYLEQLLRCPFHIGRDLLLDFFFRGLLQLVDNFPDTLAARTSPRQIFHYGKSDRNRSPAERNC